MAGFGSDVWRSLGGAGSGLFVSVPVWESGLAARGPWVFGILSPGGVPSGVWRVHFDTHAEPDRGRRDWLCSGTHSLDPQLDDLVWQFGNRSGAELSVSGKSSG